MDLKVEPCDEQQLDSSVDSFFPDGWLMQDHEPDPASPLYATASLLASTYLSGGTLLDRAGLLFKNTPDSLLDFAPLFTPRTDPLEPLFGFPSWPRPDPSLYPDPVETIFPDPYRSSHSVLDPLSFPFSPDSSGAILDTSDFSDLALSTDSLTVLEDSSPQDLVVEEDGSMRGEDPVPASPPASPPVKDRDQEINLEVIRIPEESCEDSNLSSSSGSSSKDKPYVTSFKLEAFRCSGVRTRRMAALESHVLPEEHKDYKEPRTASRKRGKKRSRGRKGNTEKKRVEHDPEAKTIHRGRKGGREREKESCFLQNPRTKRSKTVRELLQERLELKISAEPRESKAGTSISLRGLHSTTKIHNMDDDTPRLVVAESSRAKPELRPRHFPFERLEIGNFEVSYKKAKGKKNANKIKLMFSKRQFVYEFEHPAERRVVCVVVPWGGVAALRVEEDMVLVAVRAQPCGYVGRGGGRGHGVDVACGELARARVHRLWLETGGAHRLANLLGNFDPTLRPLFHQPLPPGPMNHAPLAPPIKAPPLPATPAPGPAQLLARASLVCSCRMSCRSVRCSCVKARRPCSAARSVCCCSRCDNPLNVLAELGMSPESALEDSCLMDNVYQIPRLAEFLEKRVTAHPCCGSELRLAECVPGSVPCQCCGVSLRYSWCHQRLVAAHSHATHCTQCARCCALNQRHCPHCHQRFLTGIDGPVPRACPYCLESLSASPEG